MERLEQVDSPDEQGFAQTLAKYQILIANGVLRGEGEREGKGGKQEGKEGEREGERGREG